MRQSLTEIADEQTQQIRDSVCEVLEDWGIDVTDDKLVRLIDSVAERAFVISLKEEQKAEEAYEDELMDFYSDMDLFSGDEDE